ncbi:hypothetical protein HY636_00255 [Candidatus Woesearchaeota archaeon]|nr:hypothetical protein [Candidatus Woesearchaeota archaeon]
MSKCKEKSIELDKFYTKFLKKEVSKFNIPQIAKALHELEKLNYNYWVTAYLCDAFDPNGDDMLKEEIKKYNLTLSKEEIAAFMRTNWLNYMQEERLAMLKLALNVKQKKLSLGEARKQLEKHAEAYFYIDNSWESTTVLTADNFMKRLEETLITNAEELKEHIKDIETNREKEHKKLQKKYSIPESLMNVFYFFSQLLKLRDLRKGQTLMTNYLYDLFFLRVAEIFSLNFEDLRVILAEEITKDVTAEDIKKKINARKQIIVEAVWNKGIIHYSGKEGIKIYDEINKTFIYKGDIIKGTPAFTGKVKGLIRVIMGEAHFSKFNAGEILVASMTRPEYVPLMKKAIAIITDEGGITSHAAIISRELGIPCIVGTKIATKVLKDGDVVEVNANHGVVRKVM